MYKIVNAPNNSDQKASLQPQDPRGSIQLDAGIEGKTLKTTPKNKIAEHGSENRPKTTNL